MTRYKDYAEYISCSIVLMFLQYYVHTLCAKLNDSHYFLNFCQMLTATEHYTF